MKCSRGNIQTGLEDDPIDILFGNPQVGLGYLKIRTKRLVCHLLCHTLYLRKSQHKQQIIFPRVFTHEVEFKMSVITISVVIRYSDILKQSSCPQPNSGQATH